MEKEYLENIPNAGRLMDALRNTGYNNISALSDLIDNSIDAKAERINITLEIGNPDYTANRIIVADNGSGMDEGTLRQAMRLGSDVFHNLGNDLGKYGMGLVTASISIGRKLTVITRQNGKTLTAIQDLDVVAEHNRFEITLHSSNDVENELFNQQTNVADSGTVVIISACDRIQYSKDSDFARELEEEIGRTFREFLRDDGCKFYVNENRVELNDPLWLKDEKTTILLDEDSEIVIGEQPRKIHLRAALLPNFGKKVNTACGFNMKNQGFYLMRNRREIAAGITLGAFKKHNDFNRLRIELGFSSELDNDMGINFTKRDAKPSKVIMDKISEVTANLLNMVRRDMKQEQINRRAERNQNDAPDTSTSEPAQPAQATPPATTEKAPTPQINPEPPVEETSSISFNFEYRPIAGDYLFDVISVGPKRIIYINTNSSFYQNFIQESVDMDRTTKMLQNFVTAIMIATQEAKLDDVTIKTFNRALLQALQEA